PIIVDSRHGFAVRVAILQVGQDFLNNIAYECVGDLHGLSVVRCQLFVALKTVLSSTLTVSTMPMIVASTGRFSVSGVKRALEPCTIRTIAPRPAPTVSTHTNVRPVLTNLSRAAGSTRIGSTVKSLCPTMLATFCVATTLPVTLATNIQTSQLVLSRVA